MGTQSMALKSRRYDGGTEVSFFPKITYHVHLAFSHERETIFQGRTKRNHHKQQQKLTDLEASKEYEIIVTQTDSSFCS
jgi:hypothetical protein